MRGPEEFDAFYAEARERLLAQTYALTGDLRAAQSGTRDAFTIAWHHWRKVSLIDDPETWVRPLAWRLSLRRRTAFLRHRAGNLDPEVRATVDALAHLSLPRRQILVLTQMAAGALPDLAREVGISPDEAERELQIAASQFALKRSIDGAAFPMVFNQLGAEIAGKATWPRVTIVRRLGSARRRAHTVTGVAGALAVVAVGGMLVTAADGVRPTLDRPALTTSSPSPNPAPAPPPVSADTLLTPTDFADALPGTWQESLTTALPCGLDAVTDIAEGMNERSLERGFTAQVRRNQPALSAVQFLDAAPRPEGASRLMARTARLVAGCTDSRAHLLATRTSAQVGDESLQFVIRVPGARPRLTTTHVVGLARSGVRSTVVVLSERSNVAPPTRVAARLLVRAVNQLCTEPDSGACAAPRATFTDRAPLPHERWAALLSELDLPPAGDITLPWVGTPPTAVEVNNAASTCDNTTFTGEVNGAAWSRVRTRTFVIPEAEVAPEFGLTETMGALPPNAAQAMVNRVRTRLAACEENQLNTDVTLVRRIEAGPRSLAVWRLEVEVSDTRTLTFKMAFVRNGTALAQLGFVPGGSGTIDDEAFVALARRAQQRLGELAAPS